MITNLPHTFVLEDIKACYHWRWGIEISSALKTAKKFFVRRDSHKHVDIIKLMMKYVHAVKIEFRQFDRPLRGIGAIHFGYR